MSARAAAATIDKVAWLRVERGRVLCVRSHGRDAFYLPGGKREPGESDADCLRREVHEELGVRLLPATLAHWGTIEADAHGQPAGTRLRLACWRADYEGALQAAAEIAELAWLGRADAARLSPAAQQVFARLQACGELV